MKIQGNFELRFLFYHQKDLLIFLFSIEATARTELNLRNDVIQETKLGFNNRMLN